MMDHVFAAMRRSTLRLLISDPVLLLRRLMRLAYEVEVAYRIGPGAATIPAGSMGWFIAVTVGQTLSAILPAYSRFVRWYLPARDRTLASCSVVAAAASLAWKLARIPRCAPPNRPPNRDGAGHDSIRRVGETGVRGAT